MEKHTCAFYLYFAVMLAVIIWMEHFILIPSFVDPVASSMMRYNVTIHSMPIKAQNQDILPTEEEEIEKEEESRFTAIIVTFNEPLLNKTVNNVLENTPARYLKEVLIIDDLSDVPVQGWENDPRVRIVRSEKSLGLINARILGGNEARGEFLAFIDAHVFVSPRWLNTPHQYLTENPKTIVNYVNFKLDPETYRPQSVYAGIGSSASFTWSLGIFWGGGSSADDFSPITMGMFATSKYWWNLGGMDTGMGRWGGENIEISLRTWLCGGQIRVAKDSYVAHAFRSRFPYKVNPADITRNNLRVASVWMEGEHLQHYYKSAKIKLDPSGKPKIDIGDISERLALKKQLNCKPFSWYVQRFKGRAPCSKGEKCGGGSTISPYSFKNFNTTYAFYVK